MGSILAREAPGAAVFQHQMILAYSTRQWQDGQDCLILSGAPVVLKSQDFNGEVYADSGAVYSNRAPALLSISLAKNPTVQRETLYLAVNIRMGGGYQTVMMAMMASLEMLIMVPREWWCFGLGCVLVRAGCGTRRRVIAMMCWVSGSCFAGSTDQEPGRGVNYRLPVDFFENGSTRRFGSSSGLEHLDR